MLNRNIYICSLTEFGDTVEQINAGAQRLYEELALIDDECIVICTPNITKVSNELIADVKKSLSDVAYRLTKLGKIVKASNNLDTIAEQCRVNKEMYMALVHTINRPGVDFDGLDKFLTESDFFYAPASIKNYDATVGGLCDHSLNVYFILKNLTRVLGCSDYFSDDTIKIVSLFHDVNKVNTFEKTAINKKVYSDAGTRSDEVGRFDWCAEAGYKISDSSERFVYGTGGQNSEYLIGAYVPLSLAESAAIINHLGGKDNVSGFDNTPEIFEHHPLAVLLHSADLIAAYIK